MSPCICSFSHLRVCTLSYFMHLLYWFNSINFNVNFDLPRHFNNCRSTVYVIGVLRWASGPFKKANSFLYCIVKIVNSKIFIVSATMIDQFSWRLRHTLEEHLFHFDAECFKWGVNITFDSYCCCCYKNGTFF